MEGRITEALADLDVKANLRLGNLTRDLNALKEQYTQLKQDLDALRSKLAARPPQTSMYPSNGQGTGRVRLVNTYPQPVSILVNGRVYQLNPLETRTTEPLPAGPFTFEVIGIQDRSTRTLLPGETYQIHVYPR